MSHYTVAVITKTNDFDELEELMAPFSEYLETEPYIRRTKQQIIEDAKKHKESWAERVENGSEEERNKILHEESYRNIRKLLKAKTDEELYNAERYEDGTYDEDGNELTTYNPNSKWDWYEIGGRWDGLLRKKGTGRRCNTLQIKDWDISADPAEIKGIERFWEIVVEGAEPQDKNEEMASHLYNKDYYIQKYETKENYVETESVFTTYAVLLQDGTWLAPGEMGWFGASSESPEESLAWEKGYKDIIDKLDPEWYVTIVDCHI